LVCAPSATLSCWRLLLILFFLGILGILGVRSVAIGLVVLLAVVHFLVVLGISNRFAALAEWLRRSRKWLLAVFAAGLAAGLLGELRVILDALVLIFAVEVVSFVFVLVAQLVGLI